jgi:hypothetical protein
MAEARQLNTAELEAGFDTIMESPKNNGLIELIVRRPGVNQREVMFSGELDIEFGLVGDNWKAKGYRKTVNGVAHPEMQLNIMNSRVIDLVAGEKARWPLAGDQFFVDMDLSDENLPSGTQLSIGSAVIEVTAEPHSGCKKFAERFGQKAMMFVNSGLGKKTNLRGINAKVIELGRVSQGDRVSKL